MNGRKLSIALIDLMYELERWGDHGRPTRGARFDACLLLVQRAEEERRRVAEQSKEEPR